MSNERALRAAAEHVAASRGNHRIAELEKLCTEKDAEIEKLKGQIEILRHDRQPVILCRDRILIPPAETTRCGSGGTSTVEILEEEDKALWQAVEAFHAEASSLLSQDETVASSYLRGMKAAIARYEEVRKQGE